MLQCQLSTHQTAWRWAQLNLPGGSEDTEPTDSSQAVRWQQHAVVAPLPLQTQQMATHLSLHVRVELLAGLPRTVPN